MRTYSYGAKAPTVNGAEVERQFRAAHAYYNRVIDVLREEIVARCRAESPEAKALAHEKALADMRDIYAKSGTFWGTTIATAEAAQTAAKGLRRFVTDRPGRCGSCRSEFQAGIEIEWAPGRGIVACPACPNGGYGLRYRRKGKGDLLAVQIQKGMPAAEILAGTDSRVRIVGTGGRRMLWFRIGSNGREPIWAQFPIRFHRDFPADAVVKWVRITRRRIASRQVWAAQFILDTELAILPRPTLGTIALDIGWRRVPHGLRVCVWVSDTGETGELVIPERLLGRDRKVSDLKSIRDKHFNLAKEIVHAHGKDPFTTLGEMATNVANWRSQGRLAATLIQHRSTAQLFRTLEAWRQKDKHLWEWEAHQRDNTIQSRRQMYRLFALFVAKFRNVVVEKMDLRKLTKLPEPEERLPRAVRGYRFDAAPGELFACCTDAVGRAGGTWREEDPMDSTSICADCGSKEDFDHAKELIHACSKCGRSWDQDVNAARNLLRRAAENPEVPKGPTRMRIRPEGEETAAELRRKRSLERRRAKKAQKVES